MTDKYHNCLYCNQLVLNGDPYCSKCGGPQMYKPKGGGVGVALDPWCITDERAQQQFRSDPQAVEALVNTWRKDPDHARTIEIQKQVNAAVKFGSFRFHNLICLQSDCHSEFLLMKRTRLRKN